MKRPTQAEQAWFIPGFPGTSEGPLARHRPIQLVGAVKAYVQSLTQPGDLVVDLFWQGPGIVREAVAAGRRALGLSVNPVLLAASRLGLSCCEATALDTACAATRLNDPNPIACFDNPLRYCDRLGDSSINVQIHDAD